ncbi:GATA transcription factor 19-like [Macadamia integrifolia]|uniref:GATA transcription factor 19-like n=1 Tax=Macadamia integrifolia TaxID=60698 RepID=UPI001C4F5F8F|nr:GATA transcription factor 19-like [Macadamia integrifolia]
MHRCSSSRSNTMAPCSCGLFHPQGNCFSVLFSMPNNHNPIDEPDSYNTIPSPSSSSVDCTLSLGTPSTRQTKDKSMGNHHRRSMSNLCWDIFQTNKSHSSTSTTHKSSSRGGNSNNGNILNLNGDPLFARRCANCDTTSTPLWRNGPRGPKSLCNACGIRYKKEERRATSTTVTNTGAATAGMMESQYLMSQNHQHHSWGHHAQSQKVTSMSPAALGNEFRFIEDDDDRDSSTTGIPFLSWRLNVPDRHSFVHEFT